MTNTWPGWKNVGLIGEGNFGKVYKICREEFGHTYEAALKVISIPQSSADVQAAYAEGMDEDSVTEYFRSLVTDIVAEFALMSQLKGNSNIVSYEDHMVVEHQDDFGWDILIRMELLTPLLEYVKDKDFDEAEVVRLGLHMSRALTLCRGKGIVHRDIKPENIFVAENGNFKLGDFGVARVTEKTVSAMSRKGTYNYMAPEVYKGEKYGFGADLYSLGIVMYRFLNDNRLPFLPLFPEPIRHSHRNDALNERMSGKAIAPPTHGSQELKEIVLRACAYRPEDRFQDAEELEQALRELLQKMDSQEAMDPPLGKVEGDEVSPKPQTEELIETVQPDIPQFGESLEIPLPLEEMDTAQFEDENLEEDWEDEEDELEKTVSAFAPRPKPKKGQLPPQSGRPPQQNVKPAQSQGARPPQQNVRPPQNQGAKVPQQNVRPPQNQSVKPQQNVKPPQNQSVKPQQNVKPPQNQGAKPQQNVKPPQNQGVKPQQNGKQPQSGGNASPPNKGIGAKPPMPVGAIVFLSIMGALCLICMITIVLIPVGLILAGIGFVIYMFVWGSWNSKNRKSKS